MLARVYSGTTMGLEGVLIEVEVDVAGKGFPTFTIVGLPSKAIDEARDRVRTAIINGAMEMPDSRITVNLAPADIPKVGAGFDLPIALGILVASGILPKECLLESIFIGELSLKGDVRPVPGVISLALLAEQKKLKRIFVPRANVVEASLATTVAVYPVDSLNDLILFFNGHREIKSQEPINLNQLIHNQSTKFDFSDIKGQIQARRAMEIAAAGFHNVYMKGPPGAGKTMLSQAFSGILPALDRQETVLVSQIYSICGLLGKNNLISQPPFRSPHHTTSRIGLIGGGSNPRPGEISLAHRGVLFLDEFSEFPRSVLESLRQPLEDGEVTVSRATGSLTFPARFLLLAASNPCPCGYLGHPKRPCRCLPGMILKYKKRLSGPLLDRIDIHLDVPAVDETSLINRFSGESSAKIRQRVVNARKRQAMRLSNASVKTNGEMTSVQIKKYCQLTPGAVDMLKNAIVRFNLSARSYFKIIKVAQTIADLAQEETIKESAVAEALQYRLLED